MLLLFPETRFTRPNQIPKTRVPLSCSSEEPAVETKFTEEFLPPKTADTKPTGVLTNRQTSFERSTTSLTRPIGRPSKAQFSIIPNPHFPGKSLIFRDILAPVQIFLFPIIFWACFSFGFAANCLLALNLTQSQVFAAPPYLFTPAQVGFVNFAFVVGGVVGLLTAGPLSDWVSMRATARNGGVREAEMRLIALVPYVCICLVGMVVSVSAPEVESQLTLCRSRQLATSDIGRGKRS